MPVLNAILFFIAIAAIYITSYLINQRTKKPKGSIELNEKCSSCNVRGCAIKPKEDY